MVVIYILSVETCSFSPTIVLLQLDMLLLYISILGFQWSMYMSTTNVVYMKSFVHESLQQIAMKVLRSSVIVPSHK